MNTFTLITGASSGIGLELARVGARKGNNLVLVARNEKALGELRKKLQKQFGKQCPQIEIIAVDLSQKDTCKKIQTFCKQKNITVSTLINNAGFGEYGMFAEIDLQRQLDMIAVNNQALLELTHRFMGDLLCVPRGRILNVASTASFLPGPKMATYFASKAFVLSFSQAIANELSNTNVSVTCLCPGATKTNFAKESHVDRKNPIATSRVTARDVAEYGWYHMEHGTLVAIHGRSNRIAVLLAKFIPRALLAKLVRRYQQ